MHAALKISQKKEGQEFMPRHLFLLYLPVPVTMMTISLRRLFSIPHLFTMLAYILYTIAYIASLSYMPVTRK